MKQLERQLKEYADIELIVPNEEKVKQTVLYSKKAFYDGLCNQRITYMEFLYQQMKYIKKRWWGGQAVLLLIVWFLLYMANSNYEMQRCMGVLAPSFVILIIPELWKNRNSSSVEIESTSFYTLRQIYTARMLLFAMVDIVLLGVFYGVVSFSLEIEIKRMLIEFFLPMIVTCCICFRMLCIRQIVSEYLAVAASILWIIIWTTIILKDSIYSVISIPMWLVIISCTILYLIYVIKKTLKECEKCWEVNTVWN
jgi:hypothetical protein